jgi:hypothetical protein
VLQETDEPPIRRTNEPLSRMMQPEINAIDIHEARVYFATEPFIELETKKAVVNNCKSCHFIMFDTHNSCDLGVDNLCRKYDNNYRYTVRNVLKCTHVHMHDVETENSLTSYQDIYSLKMIF